MTGFIINPSRFEVCGVCCADFTCDFSVGNLWKFKSGGTLVKIECGVLKAELRRNTSAQGGALDLTSGAVLGSALCNTKWEMRVKFNLTELVENSSNQATVTVFGATNADECTENPDNVDSVSAFVSASLQGAAEREFFIGSANGSPHQSNLVVDCTDPVVDTYFMTFRRESATVARFQLDSGCYGSGNFLCHVSTCVQSGAVGLNHLNMLNQSTCSFDNAIIYTLDNLEIYDGVNL